MAGNAFPGLSPLIGQILFGGGISPLKTPQFGTPPFFPGNPGATPPIAPPSATPKAPTGFFDRADQFLSGPSGNFLMNLLAQEGFSPVPQSPLAAIGRAGLMTQQQRQQAGMSDLQRRLIEARIGALNREADAAGQQAAPRVQSAKTLRNGNIGLVMSDGEIIDTGQKEAGRSQIINVPGLGLIRHDPVTQEVTQIAQEEIIRGGAAQRAGAEQAASTAAQLSTKQQFELPDRISAAQSRIREIDSLMDEANRALGLVGPLSTGGVGALLQNIPHTDAFALREAIKPIKAALSFDRLQAMRESSPTGGALGSVSERELDLLGAALVSLNQAQSPGDVKRALTKVLTHYGNWKSIIEQQSANLQGQQAGDVSGFRIVDPNAGN